MIDWGPLVKTLGYDTDTAMWKDLYVEKHLSIAQISRKLDVSRNVVRDALLRSGIASRARGGPNNSRVVMTDELLDEIRRDGVAAVARRLGLDYTTLYKRLRLRGISVAKLRAAVPDAQVGQQPEEKEEPNHDTDDHGEGGTHRDESLDEVEGKAQDDEHNDNRDQG